MFSCCQARSLSCCQTSGQTLIQECRQPSRQSGSQAAAKPAAGGWGVYRGRGVRVEGCESVLGCVLHTVA